MIGYINSYETTGMVDGPGIRFVVFLSGCSLRCLYCHNPETWKLNDGKEWTGERLLEKIIQYQNYYKNGGVTFSGGEPLLQKDFLLEMLKKCQENNIHTAIDTSGVGTGNYEEILKYTDLIILDIKATNEDDYQKITGQSMNEFNTFKETLKRSDKPVWIRSVIMPGINDTEEYILELKEFIKDIPNIEKIELLPYHSLGREKYEKLNIPYPLKDTVDMNKNKIKELEEFLKRNE